MSKTGVEVFAIDWMKKSGNQLYLRILASLAGAFLISALVFGIASFVVKNITFIYLEDKRDQEENEIRVRVDEIKSQIKKQKATSQEVVSQNMFGTLLEQEVYVSGVDGKIYFEGKEEGVSFEDVALSLNSVYIYSIDFEDGNGYLIIKSEIDRRPSRNGRLYVLLFVSLLFLSLSFLFVRRQLRRFSLNIRDKKPETSTFNNPAKAFENPQIEKTYTDMYVVLQQFIGETDLNMHLEGLEGPIYISGDIEKFVQVLELFLEKLEMAARKDTDIILRLEADDDQVELEFIFIPAVQEEKTEVFSEAEYRFVKERLRPVDGQLMVASKEECTSIQLRFNR